MKDFNKHPNLKFLIKPEEDIVVYFAFEKESKIFESSFKILENYFFKKHPRIKILKQIQSKKKRKKFLENYVAEYYKSHKEWIRKKVQEIQRKWEKTQKQFFSLTDKLFQNHFWPKGNYQGFVTIWGIFPRDIKRKIFQFPYKGEVFKRVEVIIAHEMLHFLFYDYLYKHFPQYKACKFAYPVWILSEAFNEAVMEESQWQKIFPKQSQFYKETILTRKKIKELRKKEKPLKEILEKLLSFVIQKYKKPFLK
jgi:hypothetical protein